MNRSNLLPAALVAVCLLYAARVYSIYWVRYAEDETITESFAASYRESFEHVFATREPDQRVWINGYVLYAPYLVMFFGELPPATEAPYGLEHRGFVFFAPQQGRDPGVMMSPGDWLLDIDPRTGRMFAGQKPGAP